MNVCLKAGIVPFAPAAHFKEREALLDRSKGINYMNKHEFRVPSTDGHHTLAGWVYEPDGAPVGILHVLHGMTEYIGRYDRFMQAVCEAGWLVAGYDHVGHGHTVNTPDELGYIAERDGWRILVGDVGAFDAALRETYGGALPLVLMGHSMGSFIARVAALDVKPDGLVVMGTGGPTAAAGVGLALIKTVRNLRGARHRSPLLDKLAFGGYNKRFAGTPDGADPHAWLTTSQEVRDSYSADPLCNYKFTASAMSDLVTLTVRANDKAWFGALPAGMPVLLVSGADDPVGDYSRGVIAVRDGLTAAGVPVTCHLYDGARHELLNDFTRDEVTSDILAFLSEVIHSANIQKEATP